MSPALVFLAVLGSMLGTATSGALIVRALPAIMNALPRVLDAVSRFMDAVGRWLTRDADTMNDLRKRLDHCEQDHVARDAADVARDGRITALERQSQADAAVLAAAFETIEAKDGIIAARDKIVEGFRKENRDLRNADLAAEHVPPTIHIGGPK